MGSMVILQRQMPRGKSRRGDLGSAGELTAAEKWAACFEGEGGKPRGAEMRGDAVIHRTVGHDTIALRSNNMYELRLG